MSLNFLNYCIRILIFDGETNLNRKSGKYYLKEILSLKYHCENPRVSIIIEVFGNEENFNLRYLSKII